MTDRFKDAQREAAKRLAAGTPMPVPVYGDHQNERPRPVEPIPTSVPACKDCRHYLGNATCGHPALIPQRWDYVNGSMMPVPLWIDGARGSAGGCGHRGTLWEAKPPKPPTYDPHADMFDAV